jgi:flagellin
VIVIINHNISAMNAHRNLMINTHEADRTMETLSSGMRINRGADDAAGLAVSEKMRGQIRGLSMASRNTQDGISLIQTAEGFLEETTAALQRIRELSVQAANGVYEDSDRQMIQTEVSQLTNEIQRIADQAEFNKKILFQGRYSSEDALNDASRPEPAQAPDPDMLGESGSGTGIRIHVGANMDQYVQVHIGDMTTTGLGLSDGNAEPGTENSKVNVTTVADANRTIAVVDEALATVTKQRTDLGAMQNRLETAQRGIDVAVENLQSAESRIRDTDMADKMVDFVRDNILSQSAISMLAQANLRPQAILRVLG